MQIPYGGLEYQRRDTSPYLLNRKQRFSKRPNSYVAAIDNSIIVADVDISLFCHLPKELWLTILSNYGLSAVDLANLEITCKWFNICWGEGNDMLVSIVSAWGV